MRRLLWTSVLFAVLLPVQAKAAEVQISSASTIFFLAETGEVNDLEIKRTGTDLTFTDPAGVDPGPGCVDDAAADPAVAVCPRGGITFVQASLADMDDEITLTDIPLAITVGEYGGDGDDVLRGSNLHATTYMYGYSGRDTYEPGAGTDWVTYTERAAGVTASIDGLPNDPDGENIPLSIDALQGGVGPDTLIGSPDDERLAGSNGNDVVRGLGGNDSVSGDSGNDRLEGGDGNDVFPFGEGGSDEILGGDGLDEAVVRVTDYEGGAARDVRVTLDDMANDGGPFENDNIHSDVEDLTAVTFDEGSGGSATLVGSERFNTIDGNVGPDTIDGFRGSDQLNGKGGDDTIEARDGEADRIDCGPGSGGVANVDQLDEVIGCETVNRETASGPPPAQEPAPPAQVRTVVVNQPPPPPPPAQRLLPTLRFNVTPARDRTAPYRFRAVGGVVLPRTVSAAQGCAEGFVSVQVKRGARTISTRRVGLKADCGFSSTVTFARRLRGRLTMTVRFLGNAALLPRTARPVALRAG